MPYNSCHKFKTLLDPEPRRLQPWEEGAFRLENLAEDDGCLIVGGDKLKLCLPLELKDSLNKCLGMRISILRTDNGYCMRLLDDQS